MFGTGFLFGLGDVIAQKTFGDKEKAYDFRRTFNLTVFGSIFAAPILLNWYRVLPGLSEKYIFSHLSF